MTDKKSQKREGEEENSREKQAEQANETQRVLREDETILIQEGDDPAEVVNHRKRMKEQEEEKAARNPSKETAETRPHQRNEGRNTLPPVEPGGNVAGSAPGRVAGREDSPEDKRDESKK